MLFPMNNLSTEDGKNQILREQQCIACPLIKQKKPDHIPPTADILVISDQWPYQITSAGMYNIPTYHTFSVECGVVGREINNAEKQCCLGRKLALISKLKPKLVITISASNFVALEEAMGYSPDRVTDGELFPTTYAGHNFWLMSIPHFDTRVKLMEARSTILQAVNTVPYVYQGNLQNIEIISNGSQLAAAFKDLQKNDMNAFDVETSNESRDPGYRPYFKGATLLTAAMGTLDRTYAFPIRHPQTPSTINPNDVLNGIYETFKAAPVVGHNTPFDMEWLGFDLGLPFLYCTRVHDTMGQEYLLSRGPKSLDYLIRKRLGFNVKKLSNVDRNNLKNTPIEVVLSYNGGDVKYLIPLWKIQNDLIQQRNMDQIYNMQMDRLPAVVAMQLKGLQPNHQMIKTETEKWRGNLILEKTKIMQLPEVQKYIAKYNGFNPLSDKDVGKIFHEVLSVPDAVTSFDEKFLSQHPSAVAKSLLDIREINKIYGTYLAPICPTDTHDNAGKFISPDGKIHAIFNTMKVITGRTSSDSPNMQNWPKRGPNKFIRNVIQAPDDYYFVAIDYGQIEYRIIAALSKDPEMIKAIKNGLDIHMFWAQKLMSWWPNVFVDENNTAACTKKSQPDAECPCKKCAIKAFRNLVKNQLVFPMCFGSDPSNICEHLGVLDPAGPQMIGDEFWTHHVTVKKWHESLAAHYEKHGWVQNIFGRRYYGPLKYTERINYPIQGSASDLVVTGMSALAKKGVLENYYDIIPVINIHDDLSFYIKKEHLDTYLAEIIPTMLDTRIYPWLPIALTAEVSVGTTWGNVEEIVTIGSDQFYPINPI